MNNIKTLIDSYIESRDKLTDISEELWAISFLGDEDNGNEDFDGCQIGDDGLNHRDISNDLVTLSNRISENTNAVGRSVEKIIDHFSTILDIALDLNEDEK
jgi:hypothetical protein